MKRIKNIFADILLSRGFSIRKTAVQTRIEALARSGTLLQLLMTFPQTRNLPLDQALGIIGKAKSQLGQDVLALSQVGVEQGGFFVEFGATNGLDLSNTYLLERDFGWAGILCEPAREWHADLLLNRSCKLDTRCVFSSTGQRIQFSEASIGELSTISSFMKSDANRLIRREAKTYEVETVTLFDLLSTHGAPNYIDFLSIDTEGSEYEILKGFDFSSYVFGLICVEHNFTANREKIRDLLNENGYSQILVEFSDFDDWYIRTKR